MFAFLGIFYTLVGAGVLSRGLQSADATDWTGKIAVVGVSIFWPLLIGYYLVEKLDKTVRP